ncbi:hypothetical protein HYPSUDRAFT_203651 [Hypholoma sublateritium FD-334 SS-4]|uniref:Uncharacterized protein n=1 Tax=Hypholoma sublateritium (strain FD-334 SS-4) TaxID=945553 RepID=A0A0D2L241_HYPSF|nr:hypothetical protein HYPSUDRAFT_203651 [Hypholoma sublateritium FD-334 SS-4]
MRCGRGLPTARGLHLPPRHHVAAVAIDLSTVAAAVPLVLAAVRRCVCSSPPSHVVLAAHHARSSPELAVPSAPPPRARRLPRREPPLPPLTLPPALAAVIPAAVVCPDLLNVAAHAPAAAVFPPLRLSPPPVPSSPPRSTTMTSPAPPRCPLSTVHRPLVERARHQRPSRRCHPRRQRRPSRRAPPPPPAIARALPSTPPPCTAARAPLAPRAPQITVRRSRTPPRAPLPRSPRLSTPASPPPPTLPPAPRAAVHDPPLPHALPRASSPHSAAVAHIPLARRWLPTTLAAAHVPSTSARRRTRPHRICTPLPHPPLPPPPNRHMRAPRATACAPIDPCLPLSTAPPLPHAIPPTSPPYPPPAAVPTAPLPNKQLPQYRPHLLHCYHPPARVPPIRVPPAVACRTACDTFARLPASAMPAPPPPSPSSAHHLSSSHHRSSRSPPCLVFATLAAALDYRSVFVRRRAAAGGRGSYGPPLPPPPPPPLPSSAHHPLTPPASSPPRPSTTITHRSDPIRAPPAVLEDHERARQLSEDEVGGTRGMEKMGAARRPHDQSDTSPLAGRIASIRRAIAVETQATLRVGSLEHRRLTEDTRPLDGMRRGAAGDGITEHPPPTYKNHERLRTFDGTKFGCSRGGREWRRRIYAADEGLANHGAHAGAGARKNIDAAMRDLDFGVDLEVDMRRTLREPEYRRPIGGLTSVVLSAPPPNNEHMAHTRRLSAGAVGITSVRATWEGGTLDYPGHRFYKYQHITLHRRGRYSARSRDQIIAWCIAAVLVKTAPRRIDRANLQRGASPPAVPEPMMSRPLVPTETLHSDATEPERGDCAQAITWERASDSRGWASQIRLRNLRGISNHVVQPSILPPRRTSLAAPRSHLSRAISLILRLLVPRPPPASHFTTAALSFPSARRLLAALVHAPSRKHMRFLREAGGPPVRRTLNTTCTRGKFVFAVLPSSLATLRTSLPLLLDVPAVSSRENQSIDNRATLAQPHDTKNNNSSIRVETGARMSRSEKSTTQSANTFARRRGYIVRKLLYSAFASPARRKITTQAAVHEVGTFLTALMHSLTFNEGSICYLFGNIHLAAPALQGSLAPSPLSRASPCMATPRISTSAIAAQHVAEGLMRGATGLRLLGSSAAGGRCRPHSCMRSPRTLSPFIVRLLVCLLGGHLAALRVVVDMGVLRLQAGHSISVGLSLRVTSTSWVCRGLGLAVIMAAKRNYSTIVQADF